MGVDHRLIERARCLEREAGGASLPHRHSLQFGDLLQVEVVSAQVRSHLPAGEVVGHRSRHHSTQGFDVDVGELRFVIRQHDIRGHRLDGMPVGFASDDRQLSSPVRIIFRARGLQAEVHHARHGIVGAHCSLQVSPRLRCGSRPAPQTESWR